MLSDAPAKVEIRGKTGQQSRYRHNPYATPSRDATLPYEDSNQLGLREDQVKRSRRANAVHQLLLRVNPQGCAAAAALSAAYPCADEVIAAAPKRSCSSKSNRSTGRDAGSHGCTMSLPSAAESVHNEDDAGITYAGTDALPGSNDMSRSGSNICDNDSMAFVPAQDTKRVSDASNASPVLTASSLFLALHRSMSKGCRPAVIPSAVPRYASVNFHFGAAWFVAPFRVSVGDVVVVEYPNAAQHIGEVSSITTVRPPNFEEIEQQLQQEWATYASRQEQQTYSTEGPYSSKEIGYNSKSNGTSCGTFAEEQNDSEEGQSGETTGRYPVLVRLARDFDCDAKSELRMHDSLALARAQQLAECIGVAVTVVDAEWLLDQSAVTYLVHPWGSSEDVTLLADELSTQEGTEVVFVYRDC